VGELGQAQAEPSLNACKRGHGQSHAANVVRMHGDVWVERSFLTPGFVHHRSIAGINEKIKYHRTEQGPVHTRPEEFENGGFTQKINQMIPVHTRPKQFKNAATTGHFGFVFENISGREIT